MKRIYVAYVGGTIGMKPTDSGYAPVPGHLTAQVRDRPDLAPEVPELTISEYDTLLDSANARPSDWLRIARDLADRRDDYDGFVVLHGTDTMAYTASALAFLLRGLGKPVVVTGSQIPLGVLRSDGRQNFLTAVLVAARDDVREVCLVFGSQILRGCRAVKASASGFEAFASPNMTPLGTAGVEISFDEARLRAAEPGAIGLPMALDAPVGLLRLYPGMPAALLRAAMAAPIRAFCACRCSSAALMSGRRSSSRDGSPAGTASGILCSASERPRGISDGRRPRSTLISFSFCVWSRSVRACTCSAKASAFSPWRTSSSEVSPPANRARATLTDCRRTSTCALVIAA
jgi:L-asparaginase